MAAMSPSISIALLLLSATVVKSLEVQTEEEEDFPPQLKHDVRESADHHTDEILQEVVFPGSCGACKWVVSTVKKKLGSDHSKAKIGELLNKACERIKFNLIRSACKTTVRKFKDKLIDAIANVGTPKTICVKLKLCNKNKPVYSSNI